MASSKIVVPELAEGPRFSLARPDCFYGDTACGITLKRSVGEDLTYVLGILNSKLIYYYYRHTTVPKANGFLIYKTMFLKNVPIARIDFKEQGSVSLHGKIVAEVKRISSSGVSAEETARASDEIDKAVYRLYGLSEGEIAEVERSISGGASSPVARRRKVRRT